MKQPTCFFQLSQWRNGNTTRRRTTMTTMVEDPLLLATNESSVVGGDNNLSILLQQEELDCPVYSDDTDYYIFQVNFWVEGVVQTAFALPGLMGNIIFSLVLTRKELRNSFNLLLVALAFFDSCYIVGAVLESLRTSFGMATDLHLMLFPYFLYPGQQTAMTISVFLIVAIAFERYVAVHNPLDYKQAMNDSDAIRRRLLKYLLPVIISSVAFNIPKFFESTYHHVTYEEDGRNVSRVQLNVTDLRIHPTYSAYVNWSQSIVLGFLPAVLLMYFNTKIYLDIRERERRRRPQRTAASFIPVEIATAAAAAAAASGSKCSANNVVSDDRQQQQHLVQQQPQPTTTTSSNNRATKKAITLPRTKPLLKVPDTYSPESGASTPNSSVPNSPTSGGPAAESSKGRLSSTASAISGHGGQGGHGGRHLHSCSSKSINAKRRKAEDKMAMIFIAIVTGFLLTNFLRIFLNFHEVIVLDSAMACSRAGFRSFPPWALILGSVSHLLMTFNSSMNILFYCVFNSQFRAEAKKAMADFAKHFSSKREISNHRPSASSFHSCKRKQGEGGDERAGGGGIGAAAATRSHANNAKKLSLVTGDGVTKAINISSASSSSSSSGESAAKKMSPSVKASEDLLKQSSSSSAFPEKRTTEHLLLEDTPNQKRRCAEKENEELFGQGDNESETESVTETAV